MDGDISGWFAIDWQPDGACFLSATTAHFTTAHSYSVGVYPAKYVSFLAGGHGQLWAGAFCPESGLSGRDTRRVAGDAHTALEFQGLAAGIPACVSNEISATAYEQARPDAALLGLLNVRYVISTLNLESDTLKLVAIEGQERLYENLAVMPHAFAVGRAKATLMIDE